MKLFLVFFLLFPCLMRGGGSLELSLLKVSEKQKKKSADNVCRLRLHNVALQKKSSVSVFCETPVFRCGLDWAVTPERSSGKHALALLSDFHWCLPDKGAFSGTPQENSGNSVSSVSRHTIRKGRTCYLSLIRAASGNEFIPSVRGGFEPDAGYSLKKAAVLEAELENSGPEKTVQRFTVPLFRGKGTLDRTEKSAPDMKSGVCISVVMADSGTMKIRFFFASSPEKRPDGLPLTEGMEGEIFFTPPADEKFHDLVTFYSFTGDERTLFSGKGSGLRAKIFRIRLISKKGLKP